MTRRAALLILLVAAARASAAPTDAGTGAPDFEALHLALSDLVETFGDRYPNGAEWKRRAADVEAAWRSASGEARAVVEAEFRRLQREALLANPLLTAQPLLFIRRRVDPKHDLDGRHLGLPQNWQGNCALPRRGYSNELCRLDTSRPDASADLVFAPPEPVCVADLDLHWDGRRLLFCMPAGPNSTWQVFELDLESGSARPVTQGFPPDIDNYDPCYLPGGDILFASTACVAGVPCVGGSSRVANLFRCGPDGGSVRQLCFDQDHNWCPAVLSDGRVMYTRWEYTDTPHYFTRLLFTMNPDGSNQRALYGSNSWWPNSTFYARQIPTLPGRIIAVISGHHGVARMGELVLFDTRRGDRDAEGAIQRIPGRGRTVEPVIADGLVQTSWPKFLHPHPLADAATGAGAGKYFVAAMKPDARRPWGLYLVDVFDNLTLIREEPGWALMEPVPLRSSPCPPVLPETIDAGASEAVVLLSDVYAGDAMRGVPRGTVKSLRLFAYHYAYPRTGGHLHIGIDGPWDARRILGTVPVEPDGSAFFSVPANTPIVVQPLDSGGRAVQVMRSWFTAMPGERLACAGCHERNAEASVSSARSAFRREPSAIAPWRGPLRPFSFRREVQPVLDRRCVGCHNGTRSGTPDLRVDGTQRFRNFTPSYVALHPYVNRPGPESDYRIRSPMEYHAETSELILRLRKGHHGVRLAEEEWDRLITWIDLNVPDHGTWTEQSGRRPGAADLRMAMRRAYAGQDWDPEAYPEPPPAAVPFEAPPPAPAPPRPAPTVATAPPAEDRSPDIRRIEVAPGVAIELVRVPAGDFVMGSDDGFADEQPPARIAITRGFWMSRHEISNDVYARFDPDHDSGTISRYNKDQSNPGEPAHLPRQPVLRVAWHDARRFCAWLSARAGLRCDLPTEAQWEYACRAGSREPMAYGPVDADFGRFANLADQRVLRLLIRDSPKWLPHVASVDDHAIGPAEVGRYEPNAWRLHDMHGNVAEWTRSLLRPYPWREDDGRNDPDAEGPRVIRGGSWRDRPHLARSATRAAREPWGRYADVGFRVIAEEPDPRP